MTEDHIAKYSIPGTTVTVYKNRLVITTGALLMHKQEMISFRNITSIEKPMLLNCIDIKTTDKKSFRIALSPGDLKALKEQIESLL